MQVSVHIFILAPCPEGEVEIMDRYGKPSVTGEGVVRVCVNGERGAVCDSGWNYESARIACISAGYSEYGENRNYIIID